MAFLEGRSSAGTNAASSAAGFGWRFASRSARSWAISLANVVKTFGHRGVKTKLLQKHPCVTPQTGQNGHEQSQRASDEEGATERKIHELKEDLDWTEDLLELVRQHLRENAPKVTRVV